MYLIYDWKLNIMSQKQNITQNIIIEYIFVIAY